MYTKGVTISVHCTNTWAVLITSLWYASCGSWRCRAERARSWRLRGWRREAAWPAARPPPPCSLSPSTTAASSLSPSPGADGDPDPVVHYTKMSRTEIVHQAGQNVFSFQSCGGNSRGGSPPDPRCLHSPPLPEDQDPHWKANLIVLH